MDRRHTYGLAGIIIATLLASGTVRSETVLARSGDAPPHDKIALGEGEVKQLVLLMDQDKNGKVSEQEFMRFMKAEFKRLDKDQSGELDVKELKESKIRSSTFMDAGK
jgi:Ca2+-binding EF-hand superfamily protein